MAESSPDPLVSVVVAFLDEERFLPRAIDTVKAQLLDDWELLLVDDGSTDGSPTTAATAAGSDARIRVLRHAGGVNAGLVASRNLGLAAARGRFVCFLDADDRWVPSKLERQVELLTQHPRAVMVCGPSWRMPADAVERPPATAVSSTAPRLLRRGHFPRLIARGAVRTPPPSDVMYRTRALRAVGGVPAGPTMHEDQRTFVAVGLHGAVLVSDEPLTEYTVRSDSVYGAVAMGDDALLIVRQHIDFERWMRRYARHHGLAGLALLIVLEGHRLRRGVGRRARLIAARLRH
ncbi:MAG TPA: glycosyltransferase family 2 protein, partial [Ilumatobacteraceae bacterium]|nr:glycosyltransferase family 2 protein [Ilumatobacteraceae bacterium]